MTHHEVLLEPVFDNACIRHVTRNHNILARGNVPVALQQALQHCDVRRLRDVCTALRSPQSPTVLTSILDLLPERLASSGDQPRGASS